MYLHSRSCPSEFASFFPQFNPNQTLSLLQYLNSLLLLNQIIIRYFPSYYNVVFQRSLKQTAVCRIALLLLVKTYFLTLLTDNFNKYRSTINCLEFNACSMKQLVHLTASFSYFYGTDCENITARGVCFYEGNFFHGHQVDFRCSFTSITTSHFQSLQTGSNVSCSV